MLFYFYFFKTERLLSDGKPLLVSSIRVLETSSNYETFSRAITVFDACLEWGQTSIPSADPDKKYGLVLKKLIDAEISGEKDGIDEYILKSFHAFTQKKKQLNINVSEVMKSIEDEHLIKNIFFGTEKIKWKSGKTEFVRRSETDKTNLFHSKLIQLFSNCVEINMMINSNDFDLFDEGRDICPISFIALLSIIEGTKVTKIHISIYWGRDDEGESWLDALWEGHGREIMRKYQETGYSIEYTKERNSITIKHDSVSECIIQ